MNFSERLKQIRLDRDLSQEAFAATLGTSKQVISRYETGQRSPKIDIANEYAEKLGVPLDYLLGDDAQLSLVPPSANNILPLPKTRSVPLIGTIACGEPILATENIEDYMDMPEGVHADFCLRCKGDSMVGARIYDGDLVYIRQQPDVVNGEIAAVLIDDEATLKRVFKSDGKLTLQAENPVYAPLVYVREELQDIRIIGKAVAFLSTVK